MESTYPSSRSWSESITAWIIRDNLRGSTDKLRDRRVYRPGLRRNLSLIFARISSRLPASSSCEPGSRSPPAYRRQEEEPLGIRDRVFFDLSCIALSRRRLC